MMPYNLLITIECKNKKSIFYFSLLISKFLKNLLIKHKKALKTVFKFRILKSPHVHKSAQHEFKQQVYKKQILFMLFDNKSLIFLKKLFFNFFQDMKKNYVFFIKSNDLVLNIKFLKLNIVNTSTFLKNNINCCSILKQNKNSKVSKLENYLKILNLIGKKKIYF